MMTLEQKLALIDKHYTTHKAWWALFKAREAVGQAYMDKYCKASNAFLWYLDRAYKETDEKRERELNALCKKLEQVKGTFWSAKCYWNKRSEDAYMFANSAFEEMCKVTEQ